MGAQQSNGSQSNGGMSPQLLNGLFAANPYQQGGM
jgi:hypothetical protein